VLLLLDLPANEKYRRCSQWQSLMVRIATTEAAFAAKLVDGSATASGRVVVAKAIRCKHLLEFFASLPPCLVGLEASGLAHRGARELITLGHEVRMMPPAYLKPYIRRQKDDASDAGAICEAVTLRVLAYNLKRMIAVLGVRPLIQPMRAS
jgi:transposase